MIVVLILLAVASRLLPHPPNFAPIAAIGLFAGSLFNRRSGWLVPFAALLLSDVFLGFYQPVGMLFNYLGFAACLLLGSGMIGARRTAIRLAGATLASSVAFFALSNFGMWANGYYPRTLAGLTECYVAAIPFFRNTLASDALYTAVLFGGYALMTRFARRREEAASGA